MNIALIHYWLVNDRGGEKVLAALAEQFPDADLFTHVYDPQVMPEAINRLTVRTTFIQKLPFANRLYQLYLPLMPWALRRLDLSGCDLIVSSESGPAKGIRKPPGAKHICYCHTPMRYLWDMSEDYFRNASLLKKIGMRLCLPRLRQWDLWSATQVDHFIANSQFVADRIKRIYGREATVIHPPADTEHFFKLKRDPQGFYLFFGQLTAYKRADLAVEAFNRLGKRLVVAGAGRICPAGVPPAFPMFGKRTAGVPPAIPMFGKRTAGVPPASSPCVEFLGKISDQKRDELYSQAKALIFPGVEDFGIIPVEAQAAGCPVIAFGQGGALETVVDGKTGIFFSEQTADSLIDAVKRFEKSQISSDTCRQNAARFCADRFRDDVCTFMAGHS